MISLTLPDMHCENCVARISAALKSANVAFEISLADKIVRVAASEVAQATAELDDLGFDVAK